jgi:hypothetical protein
MGRPTLLTPAVQEAVCERLRKGATFEGAAVLSGISYPAFKSWMQKGAAGEEPYQTFQAAVTQAREHAKQEALENVRAGVLNSGMRDWKAESWWLERMYPDEFAPQQAVNVKVEKELDGVLDKLKGALSADAYAAALAAISGINENAYDAAIGASDAGSTGGETPDGTAGGGKPSAR